MDGDAACRFGLSVDPTGRRIIAEEKNHEGHGGEGGENRKFVELDPAEALGDDAGGAAECAQR